VFTGPVGAWRLMGVCRAAREGVKVHLTSLPGFVVVRRGLGSTARPASDVWRLDLASLQWEPMPALVTTGYHHVCCAGVGSVAVIGGHTLVGSEETAIASVEALPSGEGSAFVILPPLSCGGVHGVAVIAVEESDSTAWQVLLIRGADSTYHPLSTVQLVDLATGVCTPQPRLRRWRAFAAAARLPDGRVVCAGGYDAGILSSVEVLGPPVQGAQDAAWTWTEMSVMSTDRYGCSGCVTSDGGFAVLGGDIGAIGEPTSPCEALTISASTHWEPLPPMHDARTNFVCAAMAGCIIVAGGQNRQSAEAYDEVLGR